MQATFKKKTYITIYKLFRNEFVTVKCGQYNRSLNITSYLQFAAMLLSF